MKTPAYDGVLFDFDGVLADSEPVHFACWREVLEPLGIQVNWDEYVERFIGLPDREAVALLCSGSASPIDFETAWGTYERKSALFREKMLASPPISPATRQLLKSLSNYRLAVVTASARREIDPVLEKAGIRGFFGAVVCREDAAANKPAPDPYLLGAKLLGLKRPLVVEDSDTGAAAGAAAGFEVLRVASPSDAVARLRERLSLAGAAA